MSQVSEHTLPHSSFTNSSTAPSQGRFKVDSGTIRTVQLVWYVSVELVFKSVTWRMALEAVHCHGMGTYWYIGL